MIGLIVILILIYLIIGIFTEIFIFKSDTDGTMVIFWPIVLLMGCIFVPLWLFIEYIPNKIKQLINWNKKRKETTSPTEIIQGIIALQVVKEFTKWRNMNPKKPDSWKWEYKNIYIEKHPATLVVKIGNDKVPSSLELYQSINKSFKLNKEFLANAAKKEKEMRMLDALEEFML